MLSLSMFCSCPMWTLFRAVSLPCCFLMLNEILFPTQKKKKKEDFIVFDCLSSNILMLLFFDVSDMYSLSKLSFFNLINL